MFNRHHGEEAHGRGRVLTWRQKKRGLGGARSKEAHPNSGTRSGPNSHGGEDSELLGKLEEDRAYSWSCGSSCEGTPHEVQVVMPIDFSRPWRKSFGVSFQAVLESVDVNRYFAVRMEGARPSLGFTVYLRNPPVGRSFSETFYFGDEIFLVEGNRARQSMRLKGVRFVLRAKCDGTGAKVEIRSLNILREPRPTLTRSIDRGKQPSPEFIRELLAPLSDVGSYRGAKARGSALASSGFLSLMRQDGSTLSIGPSKSFWPTTLRALGRTEQARLQGLLPLAELGFSVLFGNVDFRSAKKMMQRFYLASRLSASAIRLRALKPRMHWYDHATAERAIALVVYWAALRMEGHSGRLVSQVEESLYQLGILLSTEAFYCRNQPTRAHNHGLFQDLAVLLCAQIFPRSPMAEKGRDLAQNRIKTFIEDGFSVDGDFLVSVENSTGYHKGISTILEAMMKTGLLSGKGEYLEQRVFAMKRFTTLMTYADGRTPALGDTHFSPPREARSIHSSDAKMRMEYLPNAGYTVLTGFGNDPDSKLIITHALQSTTHKGA